MQPTKLKFSTQLTFKTLLEILDLNFLYQIFDSCYYPFQQLFDSYFNLNATYQTKIRHTAQLYDSIWDSRAYNFIAAIWQLFLAVWTVVLQLFK